VLVDFYADWCGPCKKMKPYLDEIAQEMKATVQIIPINADENPALCQDLSVDALPTIMVYKKGTMMWHNVGYTTKEEMKKYLK
jgi:thioredoxin